jgi:hypothetical protein
MAETRQSLTDMLDRYMAALVRRDSSKLPLAPNVKFTENGQQLDMKWGLWTTATGSPYPRYQDFIDPAAGQAATFTVVDENTHPVVMSLRIKVVDGHITEAEHVVCRGHESLFLPKGMAEPATQFKPVIEPAHRASREDAIRIANLYFDGIEQNNGDIIPVNDDCIRKENGLQTVLAPPGDPSRNRPGPPLGDLGVAGQINTGFFEYITGIRDRRYPLYDEEKGVIFGTVFFEHPAHITHVHVKDYGEVELGAFAQRPSSAEIAEAFQIEDGQIRTIAAILEFFPYGMKSGWDD